MLDYIKNLKRHPKHRSQPKDSLFRMKFGKDASRPKDLMEADQVTREVFYHNILRKKLKKNTYKFPGHEKLKGFV
jgi:hypothetical protein